MGPKSNFMFLLKCIILLLSLKLVFLQKTENNAETLIVELQLDDLELIDICENLGQAKKSAFLNQNFSYKAEQEIHLGSILKTHYDVLRTFTDIPAEIEKNWSYQVKPGDSLLSEEKWNKSVEFENYWQQVNIRSFKLCSNETDCSASSAVNENNLNNLKNVWKDWQNTYKNSSEFIEQLNLLKEAAMLNEYDDVKSYWEGLVDFPGGYQQAEQFWDQISPFYFRLQKFVHKRLANYYKLNSSDSNIPIFLLGGKMGTDWSYIADKVLPHPQLHYDIESYLKFKKVEDIYKYSENIAVSLKLEKLGAKFWTNSQFNSTICGPQIFEFCNSEFTEIIECNRTSWPIYLNAHETTLKIALNNMDYHSLQREKLRYCAIEDALEKLGSILAIESLNYHGISVTNPQVDSVQMTRLLLAALRIMPKLAFSLMVDKWRLEILETNLTNNIEETWWNYREKFMGIQGINNTEAEYMEDIKIIANKPYLSEFFGILMAFQFFMYHKERAISTDSIINEFANDETFLNVLKARHTTEWPYLLSIQYGLDIGAEELLKYFEPLEEYFESAPLEQVSIITTTTTTTTPEPAVTTTLKSVLLNELKINETADSGILVNDEPKSNNTMLKMSEINEQNIHKADSHVAMYVGVGILIVVGILTLGGISYRKLRRKRRTNNRRFDT